MARHFSRVLLLVEDDGAVRDVLRRHLEALGWEVIAAATGGDAIRTVEGGTAVDMLLTDLQLPDVDGVAVARAVTRTVPAASVVFMSGGPVQRPLVPAGAPFLAKPFSRAALENALIRAMSGAQR